MITNYIELGTINGEDTSPEVEEDHITTGSTVLRKENITTTGELFRQESIDITDTGTLSTDNMLLH